MTSRNILVASFIPKEKLDWFLDFIKIKFNIDKKYVFIFEVETDEEVYMLTYSVRSKERIDLRALLFKSLIIHKKKNTIYTINALNRLIELESGADSGNIVYENYKIDWDKYQDKLILIVDNYMKISNIKRIFLNN